MKIISFLNSKGGVGKTTLAINLARHLYLYNYSKIETYKPRVLLVDADPQGSIRDWQEAGNQTDIDVIAADRKQTLMNLPNLLEKSDYDYVLIDTPGNAQEITAAAISISDVCLIPVQPSPYDLWASEDIAELIRIRQTLTNGKPESFYILNRCIPRTKIAKDVFDHLFTSTIKMLGERITNRVIYATSAKEGKTIFEFDDEGAWDDISTLGHALMNTFIYIGVSDDVF